MPAHTAMAGRSLAMAGRSLAMAGRSIAGRNLMFSVCYIEKISPWPRPGFYMAPVTILVSRQGGRFARNDKLLELFTSSSSFELN